jgi:hypothetical protein
MKMFMSLAVVAAVGSFNISNDFASRMAIDASESSTAAGEYLITLSGDLPHDIVRHIGHFLNGTSIQNLD